MTRLPAYSPEQKERAIALKLEGLSNSQIAERVGIPVFTARNICKGLRPLPSPEEEYEPGKAFRKAGVKVDLSGTLSRLPELNDLAKMPVEEREAFWEQCWNVLRDAAVEAQDLKLLDTLVTKFRASTITRKTDEPITVIQPIEYCPIIPTLSLEELAIDLTSGFVTLIKAQRLTQDDANQLYSAVLKYYPESKAYD
jgi:transposase